MLYYFDGKTMHHPYQGEGGDIMSQSSNTIKM